MPKGLAQKVKDSIEKCRSATVAAVEVYNRPGSKFRTAHYLVMIIIGWTALFHAIFFDRGRNPWFRKKTSGSGKGVRYLKVDGEPKYWDLSECLKQYYGSKTSSERKNLEFLIGLRNKIEHRNLPEFDASLYGECQAALLNLEELLAQKFGLNYALTEHLAVSLQFSQTMPSEKKKAAKVLASGFAKTVKEYIEKFRGGLPSTVLNSMKYSYNVFLVPKVANRKTSADVAVEFIRVDEASKEDLDRLEKLNVLIREKNIPIVNLALYKPGQVVEKLKKRLSLPIDITTNTYAWRYYKVRPPFGDPHPKRTRPEYCIYDEVHKDYLYTRAWIEKLAQEFSKPGQFKKVRGKNPTGK